MFIARVTSAVIFFVCFWIGLYIPTFAWIPSIVLTAAALLGVWEALHLSTHPLSKCHILIGLMGALTLLLDSYWYQMEHGLVIFGLVTIVCLGLGVISMHEQNLAMTGFVLTAISYVAIPMSLIIMIWLQPLKTDEDNAQHYLLFLILTTWASDIGAYLIGRKWGKHKLAPRLSPGKTIEGFIGGISFTLLTAIGLKLFWNNIDAIFKWWEIFVLAIIFSIIGPIGDLAESWLKRASGHKDSGRTFTGHGGMLDIIDSLLFTTIFYYAYLWIYHKDILIP